MKWLLGLEATPPSPAALRGCIGNRRASSESRPRLLVASLRVTSVTFPALGDYTTTCTEVRGKGTLFTPNFYHIVSDALYAMFSILTMYFFYFMKSIFNGLGGVYIHIYVCVYFFIMDRFHLKINVPHNQNILTARPA